MRASIFCLRNQRPGTWSEKRAIGSDDGSGTKGDFFDELDAAEPTLEDFRKERLAELRLDAA